MDNLEMIVRQLNDTDLMPEQVENIETMKNINKQNALILACKLGLENAVKKLIEPIIRKQTVSESVFIPGYYSRVKNGKIKPVIVQGNFVPGYYVPDGMNGQIIDHKPRKESYSSIKKSRFSFNVLEKDGFGKTALDYAFIKDNKNILAFIYKNNASELSDIYLRSSELGLVDALTYFINDLSRAWEKDLKNVPAVRFIVNELSENSDLVHKLDADTFITFASLNWKYGNLSHKIDSKIFKKLCKGVNVDCLNQAFAKSVESPNIDFDSEYTEIKNAMITQQELLKYGVSSNIVRNCSLEIKDIILQIPYEDKDIRDTLLKEFDKIYTIDREKFETIAGKSKQVIELEFGKSYEEVLKDYVENGSINYDSFVAAIECPYDINTTRIGMLSQMGADISKENVLGDIYSKLNAEQIAEILSNSNVTLSDKDILSISKKSFKSIEYNKRLKVYDAVYKHKVTGDIKKYEDIILPSVIHSEMLNVGADRYDLINVLRLQSEEQIKKEKENLIQLRNQISNEGVVYNSSNDVAKKV